MVVEKSADIFGNRLICPFGACAAELPKESGSTRTRSWGIKTGFLEYPAFPLLVFVIDVERLRFVFFAGYDLVGVDFLDSPLP